MAEPIAALIVRILADTSEMVTGVKNVAGQLDTLESRIGKFGKVLAGVFTMQAAAGFAKEILADVDQIDTAAKRLGASTEEFQRFSFAIKQSGGDATTASAGIVSLTERLGTGDTGLLSVLRKLNINLDEFKQKDAVSRFVELATAINGVSDPTQRLELRLEAMGAKGEKALAAVDENFQNLAANAPVYSDETIQALKRIEDGWDSLWLRIKAGAAETAIALKDFLDPTKTQILDENGAPKYYSGSGELSDMKNPAAPNNLPAPLGLGGVDANDAKALAVAYADLDLQLTQVQGSAREAKEEFDSTNAVLKLLKMEVGNLAGAMGPFLDAFGTTTKVEQLTQRIIDLATRSAELRREQERLLEVINPGSQKMAGDDTDAAIFELRSDSRNWGKDGFLTPQALQLESDLINTASLRQAASMTQARNLVPASNPSGFSSVIGRVPSASNFASVVNPTPAQITIDARGSYWRDPQMMNELGRLVEDAIAGRGTGAYSRR